MSEEASPLLYETEEGYGQDSSADGIERDARYRPVLAPTDRCGLVYIILCLEGIGMLLPWNFFITAKSYFQFKYENDPSIANTFESAFSVGSMIPGVLSLFLNVFLTKRIGRNTRIYSSLLIVIGSFIVTATLVQIDTTSWTGGFFSMTIATVVVINVAGGVLQSAFFGLAGILGARYTQSIMTGQGVAGIFAALANIFTLLGGESEVASAFAYFLSAVAVLFVCLIGYVVLYRLDFMKNSLQRRDFMEVDNSLDQPVNASQSISTELVGSTSTRTPYWQIFSKVSRMAFSVSFVFFVTLALFPAVTSGIHSVNEVNKSPWTNKFFTPVVCFLLFNFCDFVGRILAGFVQCPGHRGPWLPALCISRVVFLPLFCLCNYQPRRLSSPVVFNSDLYPIIFMILFACSNGYLGSLCMMYGPKFVPPEHAEISGTIMVLFLQIGLAMGAGFSFVLVELI